MRFPRFILKSSNSLSRLLSRGLLFLPRAGGAQKGHAARVWSPGARAVLVPGTWPHMWFLPKSLRPFPGSLRAVSPREPRLGAKWGVCELRWEAGEMFAQLCPL